MIQVVFGRLLGTLSDDRSSIIGYQEFRETLQAAADADILNVWPFKGGSDTLSNLVSCQYNVGDIIHAACTLHRLEQLLPALQELLGTASHVAIRKSQTLQESLELLAEAHDSTEMSTGSKALICSLLRQWGLVKMPVDNKLSVWTDAPQLAEIGAEKKHTVLLAVGQLSQPRKYTFDLALSAAVQQCDTPPSSAAATPALPEQSAPEELATVAPQVSHQ